MNNLHPDSLRVPDAEQGDSGALRDAAVPDSDPLKAWTIDPDDEHGSGLIEVGPFASWFLGQLPEYSAGNSWQNWQMVDRFFFLRTPPNHRASGPWISPEAMTLFNGIGIDAVACRFDMPTFESAAAKHPILHTLLTEWTAYRLGVIRD